MNNRLNNGERKTAGQRDREARKEIQAHQRIAERVLLVLFALAASTILWLIWITVTE